LSEALFGRHSGGAGRGSACAAHATRRGGIGHVDFDRRRSTCQWRQSPGGARCMPDVKGGHPWERRRSTGQGVRGKGPGRRGDAGEARATRLEEGGPRRRDWTVGVTAHHLAGGLEAVAGIVTGIVSAAPVTRQLHAGHAGRDERPACEGANAAARGRRRSRSSRSAATAFAVVRA